MSLKPHGLRLRALLGIATPVQKGARSPVVRERRSVKTARAHIKLVVSLRLKTLRASMIEQVLAAKDKVLAKSTEKDLQRLVELLNFDDWMVMADDIAPIIERLLRDSGALALRQIDVTDDRILDLVNEAAVKIAAERAAELVTRISESTRDMLRVDVARAMDEGWSNQQLAKELEDNYGFSSKRSMVIARTETAYADVAGNMEAYRASGVVAAKRWVTGEGCCDLCDELDGMTIPIDDAFPTADGTPIDGPPYHPNCRCDVLPVLDTEVDE